MKKFFIPVVLIVLTPIVVAVVIMSQPTTFAQKIVEVPFSTYDGSNLGFKIGYPNNWKITLLLGSPTFVAPAETFTDKYLHNAKISVASFELPSQTRTLKDLNEFKLKVQKGFGGDLIESKNIALGGNPAHMVVEEYDETLDPGMGSHVKAFEIWTIGNEGDNRWYDIIFMAPADKYDQYLPIVQKMIDSFQFTK